MFLGDIVACGSGRLEHKNCEGYNFVSNKWIDIGTMQSQNLLRAWSVVFNKKYFFYFGGWWKSGNSVIRSSSVYRLDSEKFTWKTIGTIQQARHGHSAIVVNDIFYVVGGNNGGDGPPTFSTEKCIYANDKMTCNAMTPNLKNYMFFPGLMAVDNDFCRK